MADQNLNLRERTTVITGPLTNLTQNIASVFTQNGSDVVFIDRQIDSCQRMAGVLTDQREINDKYGRATAIQCDFASAKSCHEALSQAAQTFGSIDIYIDTLFSPTMGSSRGGEETLSLFEDLISSELKPTFYFAQQISNYLKNRKRGRMIFLLPEPALRGVGTDTMHSLLRGGLSSFVKSLSLELADQSTTVNALAIGPTEEYLLKHHTEAATIKEALEKHKAINPQVRLVNSESVAGTLLYLCSNMGSAINGQTLTLL